MRENKHKHKSMSATVLIRTSKPLKSTSVNQCKQVAQLMQADCVTDPIAYRLLLDQGAYEFDEMKFPKFSRPCWQSFPDNYNVTYHLSSHFGTFFAELQNIFLRSIAAETYMSACYAFQIASRKIATDIQEFREYVFPELMNSLKFPCFPELQEPCQCY